MTRIILLLLLASTVQFCTYSQSSKSTQPTAMNTDKTNPVYSNTASSPGALSNDEWKKILPEDVYKIARQQGTERPWSSKYEALKDKGTYYCAVCGNALFVS